MAAELQAGRTAEQAFRIAVASSGQPLAGQLAVATAALSEGADLASALGTHDLHAVPGLLPLAACCRLSAETGASLGAALDELAGSLREELRLAEEVGAQLAGPRSTVRLLAGLPLLALLLGWVMGTDPFSFLLGSLPGLVCLVAAIALECAGLAWTRRLMKNALPGGAV
jgi:tight adherence protein B